MLPVSAPFHCALMEPAQKRLEPDLRAAKFNALRFPVITNADAEAITTGEEAREALIRQVTLPVRWLDSMREMIEAGVTMFVEVGPGKVLTGLLRQIDRSVRACNVEDSASLKRRSKRSRRRAPKRPKMLNVSAQMTCFHSKIKWRWLPVRRRESGAPLAWRWRKREQKWRSPRAMTEKLASLVAEIEAAGGEALAVPMDVADAAQVKAGFQQLLAKFGKLDILVNNAAITRDTLALRMKLDDWDAVLRTNLTGAHLCMQQALGAMLKQRSGRIINITSVVAETGNAGQANYVASKAGLIGLTRAIAVEVASRNITVNAVAPGFIETPMTDVLSQELKDKMKSHDSARRALARCGHRRGDSFFGERRSRLHHRAGAGRKRRPAHGLAGPEYFLHRPHRNAHGHQSRDNEARRKALRSCAGFDPDRSGGTGARFLPGCAGASRD